MKNLLLVVFISFCSFAFSQIVIDDFNDGDLKSWSSSSEIDIENENGELKVICDSVGGRDRYNLFFVDFSNIDLTRFQTFSMKVRVPETTEQIPILRVDLRDINGNDNNGTPALLRSIEKSEDGITYTMNFKNKFRSVYPKSLIIDSKNIVGFRVYVNANVSPAYTGVFYIDDIVFEGAQNPEILPYQSEFVFNTELELGWNNQDFDDSNWSSVQMPASYNNAKIQSTIDSSLTGDSILKDVYFRKKFTVNDTTAFKALVLKVKSDDSVSFFLNGDALGQVNSMALTLEGVDEEIFVYPLSVLDTGLNVLSAHLHQQSNGFSNLYFDISLFGSRYADSITRGPYLQKNYEEGITVRWRTLSQQNSVVRFGTTLESMPDSVFIDETVLDHVVNIDGLEPNTKYYYTVGNSNSLLSLPDSSYYFKTHPEQGQEGDYNFWVIGDAGRSTADQRQVLTAYLEKYKQPTDAWLLLGDNAYQEGTDSEYQKAFFENMFEDILVNSSVFPTPGNHDLRDYGIVNQAITSAPYFDIFDLPTQGESGGVASNTESYYSWNYGNVHFVSLDSYGTSLSTLDSMYSWLEKDLKENNQKWTIAYWHHPPHSKGSHDSDDDTDSHGIMSTIRENIVPLLELYGVDLILTGHSHVYERSYLSHGFYGYSNELIDGEYILYPQSNGDSIAYMKSVGVDELSNKGTVYAVVGSSGSASSSVAWENDSLNYLTNDFFHISTNDHIGSFVLNINHDTLSGTFLNNEGEIHDHFHIIKDEVTSMKFAKGVGARVEGGKVLVNWANELTQDSIEIVWTTDLLAQSKIEIWKSSDSIYSYYDSELKTIHRAVLPLFNTGEINYAIAYNEHKYMISPDDNKSFFITVNGLKNDFEEQLAFEIYPLPTKNEVNISFNLKSKTQVSIMLLDEKGSLVNEITQGQQLATGKHDLLYDLKVKPGVYFLHLSIGEKELLKPIIIQ